MGELDSEAGAALASQFASAVAEDDTDELILDMSQTSFIDSTGMRTIIQIETAARQQGMPLVVKPPPEAVTELLQLTGVAGRLNTGPRSGRRPLEGFIERIEVALPRSPAAPARARAELREAAADLDQDRLVVATLLTSELVTNAVIHPHEGAGDELRLLITTAQSRLRVEVLDPGGGFDPQRPEPRGPEQGGRGLMLVDQLASRWGAGPVAAEQDGPDDAPSRFSVWFELETDL